MKAKITEYGSYYYWVTAIGGRAVLVKNEWHPTGHYVCVALCIVLVLDVACLVRAWEI